MIFGISERQPSETVLQRPFAVAAVADGFVVADPDARRVLRVDRRSDAAQELVCAERPWKMPMALAVRGEDLFVADLDAVVRVRGEGCKVLASSAFERATGLALSGDRLYVVDPPRHVVVALDLEGHEVLRFGSRGEGEGQLNFPTNVSALADGSLLVVDALNFRISHFAADGKFLGAFGTPGDGGGAFARPKAAVVDRAGRTYVSDAQNDVVIIYGPDGAFELAIGGSAEGPGKLTMPAGLALGDGVLYVADSLDHRVQIYELVQEVTP